MARYYSRSQGKFIDGTPPVAIQPTTAVQPSTDINNYLTPTNPPQVNPVQLTEIPQSTQSVQPTVIPQSTNPENVVRGSFLQNIKSSGLKGIANFLAPASANIAQDVGVSTAMGSKDVKQAEKSVNDAWTMVHSLIKKAGETTDPETKARLLTLARQQSETLGGISTDMQPQYSEDMSKSPVTRGLASGAELAPYFVGLAPSGGFVAKGSSVLPRIGSMAVQGGEASGMRTLLSAKDMTPQERANATVKSTVTGAVVAGGLQAGGELLNKIKPAGAKLEETGSNVRQGVRQIKQPASVYGAGKEADINQTLNDLGIKGTPGQQYAQLEPKMAEVENKIQTVIQKNPGITITKAEIKQSFLDNLKSALRSKDLTNAQAATEIDGYLNDLNKASGGTGKWTEIDLGKLRELKKLVNADYGPVYKIADSGGALSPRQKVIQAAWDSLDNAVKNASPEMKTLLSQESNLYKAAPSLSSARFNPPTLRAFGTSIPGAVTQTGQDVAGRVMGSTGKILQKLPDITGVASTIAPIIPAATNLIPEQTQEQNYNTQNNGSQNNTSGDLPHITTSIPQTSGQSTLTGYTPEQLYTAYMKATSDGNTKAASQLKGMYSDEIAYQKTQGKDTKSLSSTQINQVNLAKSGLRGLNKAEQLLGLRDETGTEIPNAKINMSILTKQLVPGKLLTRDYEAAAFSATEALLRARSGAAVPETEVKRYTQKLFPVFGDSEATVLQKLTELRNIFSDLSNQQGAADQDVIQNLITP